MSQVLVKNGTWKQNNASFYGFCQMQNETAKVRKYCQKMPNCQTQISTFENARFDLFGIFQMPVGNPAADRSHLSHSRTLTI